MQNLIVLRKVVGLRYLSVALTLCPSVYVLGVWLRLRNGLYEYSEVKMACTSCACRVMCSSNMFIYQIIYHLAHGGCVINYGVPFSLVSSLVP